MDYEIPIYIINLKKEKNRRDNCLKELEKLTIPHKIIMVDAVDAQEAQKYKYCLSEKAYKNIMYTLKSTVVVPTWGAFACALSHMKCWKLAYVNSQPYSLIIEDDIIIENPEKFQFRLYSAFFHLQRHSYDHEIIGERTPSSEIEPHIFVFDARRDKSAYIRTYHDVESLHCVFTDIHCYMINKKAAQLMINKIFPLIFQVDIQMFYISKKNKLHIYNYFDGGTKQDKRFPSSVQYYFVEEEELIELLSKYPEDIVKNIYSYLPKKPTINADSYNNDYITGKLTDGNISAVLYYSDYY